MKNLTRRGIRINAYRIWGIFKNEFDDANNKLIEQGDMFKDPKRLRMTIRMMCRGNIDNDYRTN